MTKIKIDINDPKFQKDLFGLEKNEQTTLLNTLKKISKLSWEELYKDSGLKWEAILSKKINLSERIYSFRFSQKYRATALREDEFLRILALHVDHDGAYN